MSRGWETDDEPLLPRVDDRHLGARPERLPLGARRPAVCLVGDPGGLSRAEARGLGVEQGLIRMRAGQCRDGGNGRGQRERRSAGEGGQGQGDRGRGCADHHGAALRVGLGALAPDQAGGGRLEHVEALAEAGSVRAVVGVAADKACEGVARGRDARSCVVGMCGSDGVCAAPGACAEITRGADGRPQAAWKRVTSPGEGKPQPGPGTIASSVGEFLRGRGRDLAEALFTPEERGLMAHIGAAHRSAAGPEISSAGLGAEVGRAQSPWLQRAAGALGMASGHPSLAGAAMTTAKVGGGVRNAINAGRAVQPVTVGQPVDARAAVLAGVLGGDQREMVTAAANDRTQALARALLSGTR